MRYITAIMGAIVVFFGTLVASVLISQYLPPFLQVVTIGPFQFRNSIGFVLAPIAAYSSYRSTLRHYRNKDLQRAAPRAAD